MLDSDPRGWRPLNIRVGPNSSRENVETSQTKGTDKQPGVLSPHKPSMCKYWRKREARSATVRPACVPPRGDLFTKEFSCTVQAPVDVPESSAPSGRMQICPALSARVSPRIMAVYVALQPARPLLLCKCGLMG